MVGIWVEIRTELGDPVLCNGKTAFDVDICASTALELERTNK